SSKGPSSQALAVSGEQGILGRKEWIVDSGATHHMTGDPTLFQAYKLCSGREQVSLADGSSTNVAGQGCREKLVASMREIQKNFSTPPPRI
ncbi:hypothetical protein, partial [Klebsiella pneumoniae]|uniref:hypothetical protein n=1 Tax=Klebsiella pneumoniae TaxID=573 RepID=UPI0035322907